MPVKNRDVFVTTTTSVIVFTTLVCGGLTEPMLGLNGMKRDKKTPQEGRAMSRDHGDGSLSFDEEEGSGGSGGRARTGSVTSRFNRFWEHLDSKGESVRLLI
jgi:sodium/hydrogen exchanger 8